MGMRMPETCWAVFERRAINLRDWCIWLVDLFECMMMHELTNSKFEYLVVFEYKRLSIAANMFRTPQGHGKMHLNKDTEYILWPWGYREHIHMWIRLYVVHTSNFYYERLRINLPPHWTNYKAIATGQLTRLIRQCTAYVLVQRTLLMCFVEFFFFFFFCTVHCNTKWFFRY
jgi:hypothetical protein